MKVVLQSSRLQQGLHGRGKDRIADFGQVLKALEDGVGAQDPAFAQNRPGLEVKG